MIETKNIPQTLLKRNIHIKLQKICKENDVVFMVVFGSYVRGEQKKNSDIDIAIKYDISSKKTYFDIIDLEDKLSSIFGKKVDLGIYDSINPYIIEQIKKEMIVLYERQ
jgi:uncharacterized protein